MASSEAPFQLKDLLTPATIRLHVAASDPGQVIREAGQLLLASGAIEERYIEAMQQALQTYGPYMVIVPGVALLHARPSDGVKRPCMSLLTLEPPVSFGNEDNDPVKIAIAFGAVDRQKHLEALTMLTQLLANEQALSAIQASTSAEEVMHIIAAALPAQ
ncbi:PTS sugar transporter subunit IIA [Thermogemmatispora onikobensis]|uniref:PTS sugar transporter subunit IIA n=1 Tax=Thermogemmatispora onikobensis TaxID=732234 RepID=UPI000853DCF7|nr:PTS sugar transporter subunit IIA [Thermogemmatispora onikobensis]